MIARWFRAAGLLVAVVAAAVVGVVAGHVAGAMMLPDLDDVSVIADRLVPAEATNVISHEASHAGPQNLNLFVLPTPGDAYRSWDPADAPIDDVERIGVELVRRGWQKLESEPDERRLANGFHRASVDIERPSQVDLAVTWDRGWLLFLPSMTTALVVAALLGWAVRRKPTQGHR